MHGNPRPEGTGIRQGDFSGSRHRTKYSYDDQGRLLQLANVHPTAGNLATFAYGYDVDNYTGTNAMLGQRTSMTMNFPSANQTDALHKYYYDSNYQLTRADYPQGEPFNGEVHQWTYDAIGNRLTNTVDDVTQTYTYYKDGGNPKNGQRLQSDGVNTYTFDGNGNTITKSGPGGTFNFAWDNGDRLITMTGVETAGYTYDHLGRRASSTVAAATARYLYRGRDLVLEEAGEIAQYLFGPGIDEPLVASRISGASMYVVDALASVGGLANTAGSMQGSDVYDAWGVARSHSTTVPNPFGYTAREYADGGLWFYRSRFEDADTARFLSEDPARSYYSNDYAYVNNNPVDTTDPFGLFAFDDSCYYRSGCCKNIQVMILAVREFRTRYQQSRCKDALRRVSARTPTWANPNKTTTMYDYMPICDATKTVGCDPKGEKVELGGHQPGSTYIWVRTPDRQDECTPAYISEIASAILHECIHAGDRYLPEQTVDEIDAECNNP